jgi:chemotaxis protein CheD
METKIIGIGEIGIINQPGQQIKTMALGSCVAVIFVAISRPLIGMAHVALPDSSIGNQKSRQLPGYFADVAVNNLIKEFIQQGITKRSDIQVALVGGASIMDPHGVFNIGARNVQALRNILQKNRLGPHKEDVGENYSRTVWADIDTGKIYISSPRKETWEL